MEKAADALAIDTLLISDKLFRYIKRDVLLCANHQMNSCSHSFFYLTSSDIGKVGVVIPNISLTCPFYSCICGISLCLDRHQEIATRSRYVRLVDSVRDNGGTVRYDLRHCLEASL